MRILFYTTLRMGWEWEYGNGNDRECKQKSLSHDSRTVLL